VTATVVTATALATAVRAAPSAAAPEPAPAHWSARRRRAARVRFPARAPAADWPGTHEPAPAVAARLAAPPFTLPSARCQHRRARGVGLALDWLADQSGATWQQRWQAGGADPLGAGWRAVPNGWLAARGAGTADRTRALCLAVTLLVGADVLRPSLPWLVATAGGGRGALVPLLAATRDPDGFARLAAHCAAQPGVSAAATRHMLHRAAMILAAKGGPMAEITVGDVLELFDVEAQVNAREAHGAGVFYRMLRGAGMLGEQAPATLAQLRTDGPATPGQLIDRYRLACRPVRDLLVDYLSERAPALDYNSLRSLARFLGSVFWADLERHHPGIDSLHLPTDVATAWKRRLRTATTTPRAAGAVAGGAAGGAAAAPATRVGYRECLTPVRAFYLDLACWAGEDPARWARWVAPCPIGAEEIHRRKAVLARKARMDARTRARLPALPALLDILSRQRAEAALALATARATPPGQTCPVGAQVLRRCQLRAPREATVWVDELATGRRRDLALEEDHAFWVWAAVEVLRSTGVRIEELLELGHHALISYRLPTTGEVVPLLQIVPSKTDAERLLLVSPELADVLAAVLHRIRDAAGVVPLVARYDAYECVWSAPAPLLFQRRVGSEPRAMTMSGLRRMLAATLARTGLVDPATGGPLHFTPHDFRRMFLTDAIASGLPPHIAQVIAGHRDLNVTLGYKAVYPTEAIQAHRAFLARRRALRPSEEYRTPTDGEWQEFLGHFERRQVSTGTCARAFATPCLHEHACICCPVLRPDPHQRPRLVEIRDNLLARIAEAEREGWLGEAEGLRVSLAGAQDKLSQLDRRPPAAGPVGLGTPRRRGVDPS
jgi:integrase